jgi:hypothetical protein
VKVSVLFSNRYFAIVSVRGDHDPEQLKIDWPDPKNSPRVEIDFQSIRKKIHSLVHLTSAVAIGLIYSQNLVSAMLRTFVSF